MKLRNKYYIMRHGQALSNVKALCSCWPEKITNQLTKAGKDAVKESAQKLKGTLKEKNEKIDLIFCSPLQRTKQTAEITSKILRGSKPKIDKRLREIGFGIFNGKHLEGMWKYFKKEEDRIRKGPPKGESYAEISERMSEFLKDIDKKYSNKNILVVSHEGPLMFLIGKVEGLSIKQTVEKYPLEKRIHKAEIKELN